MSLAFAIALYVMIWWTTLFAVLPFGVRTQGEAGDVVPGTPASAPVRPRMIKAFLVNTVVASLVFAFVWAALEYDWIGLRIPVPPAPTH
jgi:predicted secreted protein